MTYHGGSSISSAIKRSYPLHLRISRFIWSRVLQYPSPLLHARSPAKSVAYNCARRSLLQWRRKSRKLRRGIAKIGSASSSVGRRLASRRLRLLVLLVLLAMGTLLWRTQMETHLGAMSSVAWPFVADVKIMIPYSNGGDS